MITALEIIGKLIGGSPMIRLFPLGHRNGHGSNGIDILTASVIFVLLMLVSLTAGLKKRGAAWLLPKMPKEAHAVFDHKSQKAPNRGYIYII